jgi:hypothetical protein
MVTEQVKDYTHLLKDQKGVFGQMVYTYTSPTHWGSDGLCEIRVTFWGEHRDAEINLSYGAGGWNKGFTNAQIAEAMSEAFALATHRLAVLDKCPWQAQPKAV